MIITTHTSVALLCPHCGRLSWHELSLFKLNGQQEIMACECGTPILTVEKKKSHYWFQTDCVFCEKKHIKSFTRREMITTTPLELYCLDADYVTGCIGPRDKVEKHIKGKRRSLTQLATEVSSPDYFENPDVMFTILARFYEVARTSGISCPCGNEQFEVDILPGEIKIRCQECNLQTIVPASQQEDLELFLQEEPLFFSTGETKAKPIDKPRLRRKSKYIR